MFSFLRLRSTNRNGFQVPGKSKIELMPHEVRSRADALRAYGEAGSLVAPQITKEHFSIPPEMAAQLKPSIDRIIGSIGRRQKDVIAEKRDQVPIVSVAHSHIQLPSARKLSV